MKPSILDQPSTLAAHERYKFKPFRGSSHSWALAHLCGRVTGSRILDVGAGGGVLGTQLRPFNPDRLVAIEIDERAHPTLSRTYDAVHTACSAVAGQRFDYILLLDILEHLADPKNFLSELRTLLAPGGQILVSVPNVAHWSVRFPLFFCGRFEYRALGIMDRTHLQFFCRRSFHRMCKTLEDCTVVERAASIEPFELALPTWVSSSWLYRAAIPARLALAQILPGLLAYQHLAIIQAPQEGVEPRALRSAI